VKLDKYEFLVMKFLLFQVLHYFEALIENPKNQRGENNWVDKIYQLMDSVDSYIPTPARETDKPFLLAVETFYQLRVVVL
jgi:elongation factor Tu